MLCSPAGGRRMTGYADILIANSTVRIVLRHVLLAIPTTKYFSDFVSESVIWIVLEFAANQICMTWNAQIKSGKALIASEPIVNIEYQRITLVTKARNTFAINVTNAIQVFCLFLVNASEAVLFCTANTIVIEPNTIFTYKPPPPLVPKRGVTSGAEIVDEIIETIYQFMVVFNCGPAITAYTVVRALLAGITSSRSQCVFTSPTY
jgi:hypothetical protein